MITKAEIRKLIEKAEEGPRLDYKEDLVLESEGDKAQFVKDVLALANSAGTAHIITGVEDKTGKLVGIKTSHIPEQLNEILKDKCDPPLRVEYMERDLLGYEVGVIEVKGDNPPYIVAVRDKYGGSVSTSSRKTFFIERGTVFVRNFNMNDGASRDDLNRMYAAKYATPQANLRVDHEIEKALVDDLIEVTIKFVFVNDGDAPATNPYVILRFKNIAELVKCTERWRDISHLNEEVPTIVYMWEHPIYCDVRLHSGGAIVRVNRDTRQIETHIDMQAGNMQRRQGQYDIPIGG